MFSPTPLAPNLPIRDHAESHVPLQVATPSTHAQLAEPSQVPFAARTAGERPSGRVFASMAALQSQFRAAPCYPPRCMSRPGPTDPERVRNLIALDARNLMTRLRSRRPEIISIFSRSRDRAVLISTLRSWFEDADANGLLLLEPEQQSAVSAFYEAVETLRFYFHYTEDMPGTVDRTLTLRQAELETHYVRLTRAIGGPVPVELSDLQDVTPAKEATREEKGPVVDAEWVVPS